MSNETAKQAYKASIKKIEKRLSAIRKELDNHCAPGETPNWAQTGDLGYVEGQLHIIEAFLKNEDIDD